MRMYRLLILLFSITCFSLSAQKIAPSVIASAGHVIKAGNLSLEWTLGEVVTETRTSSSLIVTQGFHQGNLGTTLVQNQELTQLNVYPNPTTSIINIENPESLDLQFTLTNIEGKIIMQNQLRTSNLEINLEDLSQGNYILVFKNKNEQKSFNIQKIK